MADTKMIKTIGEHWVCATLARRNWAPALTRDGIERTDILAVGTHLRSRPTIEIQVKTSTDPAPKSPWFLGKQGPPSARSANEWFVCVLVPSDLEAPLEAFVVPRDHISAAAWIYHHHKSKAFKQERKTKFNQFTIPKFYLKGYKERWDLLDRRTSEAPVRLPGFLPDWAKQDSVCLPPDHPWGDELPEKWDYPWRRAPAGWRDSLPE
jgi:hypothetical protein